MSINRIESAMAWKGPEIDYRAEMMHLFQPEEIAEIDAALAQCRDLDIPEITAERFPLPTFGATLRRLKDGLLNGRGAMLLRGFPRDRYSVDEMARVYVGIGAHMGRPLAQSWKGELLGSVINISDIVEGTRGYNQAGEMMFHVDGTACDIVSLMCLRGALSGGASRIVSVAALHNHMLDTRPDLLEILYRGFFHRNHEMDALHSPLLPLQTDHRLPFLTQREGRVTCAASGCIRYAMEQGGVPVTAAEVEALEEWQRLARSPDFHLDMDFEAGDIQFLNNRAILHGRTDYEDHADVTQRRHLLRLWLRVPEWPARETNQIYMTEDSCRYWQDTNRRPMMDLPGNYVVELQTRQAQRIRDNTVLAITKSVPKASDWVRG